MLTLRAHALIHLKSASMTLSAATRMLDRFIRGPQGKDVPWDNPAQGLPQALKERLDQAATGWMLNPANQQPEQPEPTPITRAPRDGKMLAAEGEPPEAA